jgi:inhibitor of KinA sporulation pathway (predicted exonuclease)
MINGYGEEKGTFNRFIKPAVNGRLSAFCTELTSIEQHQVSAAEIFPTVLELFWDWAEIGFSDYTLVSWGKEDQQLLRNDCELHDIDDSWLTPHLNLKTAYRHLKRLNKNTGLVKTLEREGLEFEGTHHRAIDDAINTAKIFLKYRDEWPH